MSAMATDKCQNQTVQREKTLPAYKRMMLIRLQAGRTYPLEARAMKEPPSRMDAQSSWRCHKPGLAADLGLVFCPR